MKRNRRYYDRTLGWRIYFLPAVIFFIGQVNAEAIDEAIDGAIDWVVGE